MSLFEVTPYDKVFYETHLKDFLPPKIIDIHTHVWLKEFRLPPAPDAVCRTVAWPSLVAADNSIEDLQETYRLFFPQQEVTPLIFGNPNPGEDFTKINAYVEESARSRGYPALYFSHPAMAPADLEQAVLQGGFLGLKSYLSHAPAYLPEKEIRIFDFFPRAHLELCNRHGWIVMLHIPRDGRLKDPVNLAQILEIKRRYPAIKLIIAHVGRAYCPEDVGDAFDILAESEDLLFDFCANCNAQVFEKLLRAVGPQRVLFGSDLPILRMRTRRICENGTYINLVPPGLYGDPKQDAHLREVAPQESEKLTFFMYEELYAMKLAAQACKLTPGDVGDLFYGNGARLLQSVASNQK